MGKLKTAVALGGMGIDLLVGNVSPLYWESFMPYEILNEVKTYVGELPLLGELFGKNPRSGKIS